MKSDCKKSLTNTSSVNRVLPKRKRQVDDKYEIRYGKIRIGCRTAKDAARLAKELNLGPQHLETAPWRLDEFTDFVNRIQWTQRKLLNVLLQADGEVYDYDLRGKLMLDGNQALAGVLSGITKVAQAMDIDPKRVYAQVTEYNKGLPERRYRVTYAFRKAAKDADWPSPDDLKPLDEEGE